MGTPEVFKIKHLKLFIPFRKALFKMSASYSADLLGLFGVIYV